MSSSADRIHLGTVVALAHLLECVEAGKATATAEGYRQLVLRLQVALSEEIAPDALQAILNAYPATAQIFENMHYDHSGLLRAPLELSISCELQARQLL